MAQGAAFGDWPPWRSDAAHCELGEPPEMSRRLDLKLSLEFDKQGFLDLIGPFCERVERIGIQEAERRLGFGLEELEGDMVDIVPSNDGLTIYVRPSDKLRRAVEAVMQTAPLLRAIGY